MLSKPPAIESILAEAYVIPTDAPESDGTHSWTSTTLVVVEIDCGGAKGLGYTYSSDAAVRIVLGPLREVVVGADPFAIPHTWAGMVRAVRNLGWRGQCATAISAVDVALWDLKAKLLGVSLAILLGPRRNDVPIYGSGGFTTYTEEQLCRQLADWVEQDGCRFVKMKIGSDPAADTGRVRAAARAIGDAELFVDANGAYDRKQALAFADRTTDVPVTWFEEPVSSDDLEGLRFLRSRVPAPLEIAAGEYGYDQFYFRRMLEHGAVDVLQADATRCGGITGFLQAAHLADAHMTPLSAHTAPAIHLPVCCAVPRLRHIEWFHDHSRIERMLFDGLPRPHEGRLVPDLSRPGMGIEFKRKDAERFSA